MSTTPPDLETRHALVFAIAHELGNHLAAIRLEAHLLDEALGASGLARASLAIDGLAGLAAPLLASLRPLLTPGTRAGGMRVEALLAGVARQLEEEGLLGRRLELDVAPEAGPLVCGVEGAPALLTALVGSPESLDPAAGPIRLAARASATELVLVCELPGDAFAEVDPRASESAPTSALRGRALAAAIARVLVADAGGRTEVEREAGRSRIVMRLPR